MISWVKTCQNIFSSNENCKSVLLVVCQSQRRTHYWFQLHGLKDLLPAVGSGRIHCWTCCQYRPWNWVSLLVAGETWIDAVMLLVHKTAILDFYWSINFTAGCPSCHKQSLRSLCRTHGGTWWVYEPDITGPSPTSLGPGISDESVISFPETSTMNLC